MTDRALRHVVTTQVPGVDGDGITTAEKVQLMNNHAVVKERVIDLSDYVDISGTSNSTAGLQQAINDAESADSPQTLFLRSGSVINIDAGEIVLPASGRNRHAILGDGVFGSMIKVSGTGPAFQLDPSTTPSSSTRRQYWRMENMQIIGPGRSVSGSVGLHVNNALQGYLSNVQVNSFETGVHVDGHNLDNGAAAYYNDFYKLAVSACGVALLISGQANSNRFVGGSFRLSEIGVHVIGSNNVVFTGSDIEGNSQYGIILDAAQNHLLGVRLENRDANYEIEFRDSSSGGQRGRNNTILSYWSSTNPYVRMNAINGTSISENTVIAPGYNEMGDVNSVTVPYGFHLTRSRVGNDRPLMLLEDTYTSSGTTDGYVYRYSRTGSRPFVARKSTGDTFVMEEDSGGQGIFRMPTANGGAQTTIRVYHLNPEGVIAGNIGDLILRSGSSGGLYVKESGNGGNTGWVKK